MAATAPFDGSAAGPLEFGADINLRGVIDPYWPQPTLEFRALPADLDAARTLDRLATVLEFLERAAG